MKACLTTLAIVLLSFSLGCDSSHDTAWHWAQIKRYNEYIENPKNLKTDERGLRYLDNVPDIMPSLHALELEGEITHLDLVFPNVPATREVTQYWMSYCQKTDGIIVAEGNHSYMEYQVKGVHPVHLNIWFETAAKEKVKELIEGIERFGKNR